jgi:hypothetical protein
LHGGSKRLGAAAWRGGLARRPGAADRSGSGRRLGAAAWRGGLARRIVRCRAACPAGIIRTAAFDVKVAFMQPELHGWDIHTV